MYAPMVKKTMHQEAHKPILNMSKLNVPILYHVFPVEDMETLVMTRCPVSFVRLTLPDEDL